jgi:hypothetical protein
MADRQGTAAQINTYPMDLRHFQHLLPHQIRAWQNNVDRIVVTIDTHRSAAGRFHGSNFGEMLEKLRRFLRDLQSTYPHLQVAEVDYSPPMQSRIGQYFFGLDSLPPKAWNGEYFYALFYGLYVADAQYVVHFDSDMLFGGGSGTWMKEAIACMEERPDVLVTSPFPGPPNRDAQIFGHPSPKGFKNSRERLPYPAYRFMHVSSRVFMMDLTRFKARLGTLPWMAPSPLQKLKARLLGQPGRAIGAEVVMSKTLERAHLYRIDMLGTLPGMWSLHPPYRSEEFYNRLPAIIRAVEAGEIPEGQRGHFDLNDSMVDWSQARAANRWHQRYLRIIRQRLSHVA